jgi:hypothetical protein
MSKLGVELRLGVLLMLRSLIMLLIQSDMFKALWFMVYPIVTYLHGPASNDSIFCQVNGFFLSVGIEASGSILPLQCTMA